MAHMEKELLPNSYTLQTELLRVLCGSMWTNIGLYVCAYGYSELYTYSTILLQLGNQVVYNTASAISQRLEIGVIWWQ